MTLCIQFVDVNLLLILLRSQFTLKTANGVQLYEGTIHRFSFALAVNDVYLRTTNKETFIIFFAVPNTFFRQSRKSQKDKEVEYSTIRRGSRFALRQKEKKSE